MSYLRTALLSLAALTIAAPATSAAPILFFATGTTAGSTLSGSVTIESTNGNVTAVNLIMSGLLSYTANVFVYQGNQISSGTSPYLILAKDASGNNNVQLQLPVTTLLGYNGGNICTTGAPCSSFTSTANGTPFTGGSLSTATPEPTGLALVGGLLVGLASLRRRR